MNSDAKLGFLKAVDRPNGDGDGLFSVFLSLGDRSFSGGGDGLGDWLPAAVRFSKYSFRSFLRWSNSKNGLL